MGASRGFLGWILNSIADAGVSLRGSLAGSSIKNLCRDLVSERGEASGTAIAREIVDRYRELDGPGRISFFESLLKPFWLADPAEVLRHAQKYSADPDAANLAKVFRSAEPKRMELFRRINTGPNGTETIVKMRSELLALLPKNPQLEPINVDLTYLLSTWFNRGFLEMRRIDWRTPPVILEKLIQYEAVHEIQGWPDLRRRLQEDRRCFAFFHSALPDEPLIFVQIALTRGIPSSIQTLLDISNPPSESVRANAAVFYSISNCQDGLRNISFGAFLLKQVIHELKRDDPAVRTYVTLSPIPGFRTWLTKHSPELAAAAADSAAIESRREELTRACARYLTTRSANGRASDPVAHFHLSNGASIEQIDWMGDTSSKGLRQSYGLMVNYLYQPVRIERNHELYIKEGEFATSEAVRELLEDKSATPKRGAASLRPSTVTTKAQ